MLVLVLLVPADGADRSDGHEICLHCEGFISRGIY